MLGFRPLGSGPLGSGALDAGTVAKVNFRGSSGDTADTFGTWNHLTSTNQNETTPLLDFYDGTDTGWDITITDNAVAASASGMNVIGTGDAAWVDEATVSDTYHYVQDGNSATYQITGLNDSNTYTIKVYGSRDGVAPRDADYSVDGFASFINVEAAYNSTDIALFENVAPSLGAINLDVRKGSGEFGYINAVEIEEFSGEPTPPLIEAADCASTTGFASSWDIDYNAYSTGDLVVFNLASDAAVVTHGTLPAGPDGETIVELINSDAFSAGGGTVSVWYYIATSTEAAGNVTVTPSGSEGFGAISFVVPAGEFDDANPIEAFNNFGASGGTSVPSPELVGTTADGTVIAFLGIDSDTVTATPSGWTDIASAEQGQVNSYVSTRDAATTASETIASASWTIDSDSSTTAGYVVNAPAAAGGGPATITGNVSQTLGALTQALTGTETSSISGDVIQSVGGLTQGLVGSITPPFSITGNITQNMGALTQSLSGTETSSITGNTTQSIGPLTQDLVATLIPPGTVTGNATQSLSNLTQNLSGTVTSNISGNITQSLGSLTQSLDGTETSNISGNISQSMGSLSQSLVGSEISSITSNISQTLGSLNQDLIGTAINHIAVNISQTLGGLNQDLTGTVTLPPPLTGNILQVIGNLTQGLVGTVTLNLPEATGNINQTLGGLSQSGVWVITSKPSLATVRSDTVKRSMVNTEVKITTGSDTHILHKLTRRGKAFSIEPNATVTCKITSIDFSVDYTAEIAQLRTQNYADWDKSTIDVQIPANTTENIKASNPNWVNGSVPAVLRTWVHGTHKESFMADILIKFKV